MRKRCGAANLVSLLFVLHYSIINHSSLNRCLSQVAWSPWTSCSLFMRFIFALCADAGNGLSSHRNACISHCFLSLTHLQAYSESESEAPPDFPGPAQVLADAGAGASSSSSAGPAAGGCPAGPGPAPVLAGAGAGASSSSSAGPPYPAGPLEIIDAPPASGMDPDIQIVNHEVFHAGEKIGSIKPVHENTKKEAVSIYCKRHQCSIMIGIRNCPPHKDLCAWLAEGVYIPKGRAHQSEHKKLMQQYRDKVAR